MALFQGNTFVEIAIGKSISQEEMAIRKHSASHITVIVTCDGASEYEDVTVLGERMLIDMRLHLNFGIYSYYFICIANGSKL